MGGLEMLMNITFFVIYPLLNKPTHASQGESGSPENYIQRYYCFPIVTALKFIASIFSMFHFQYVTLTFLKVANIDLFANESVQMNHDTSF